MCDKNSEFCVYIFQICTGNRKLDIANNNNICYIQFLKFRKRVRWSRCFDVTRTRNNLNQQSPVQTITYNNWTSIEIINNSCDRS